MYKKVVLSIVLLTAVFIGAVQAQTPPPPPGGPGIGDPPIGGTLPIGDGVVFLLILVVIYSIVKIYKTKSQFNSNSK